MFVHFLPILQPYGGEVQAARDLCLCHYAGIGLCFAALREQYTENAHLLSDRTIPLKFYLSTIANDVN